MIDYLVSRADVALAERLAARIEDIRALARHIAYWGRDEAALAAMRADPYVGRLFRETEE